MRRASRLWAHFAIWLLGAGLAHAATIYQFNDPVSPGDTVLVTGSDLATATSVRVWRLSSDDPTDLKQVGRNAEAAAIREADPRSLSFEVPRGLQAGIYGFIINTPAGDARGILNAPTVYWGQGDLGRTASPGGWIRVVGRNIARGEGARLQLRRGDATLATLSPSKFDLWDASFAIPSALKTGSYELWLNNGAGAAIWRSAGSISIAPAEQQTKSRSLDVRDFGAVPDGTTDASDAFDAALAAAADNGGGTVAIPQGTFLLTKTLDVPDGVNLAGAGMDRSMLVLADSDTPPDPLIQGNSRFAVRDLSIIAKRHQTLIDGGRLKRTGGRNDGAITLERVRIRASVFMGHLTPDDLTERLQAMMKTESSAIHLEGPNIRVVDCDIRGSTRSLFVVNATDALISGNLIGNGRRGWYSISGSKRVIFENNRIYGSDLQGSGGGLNTLRSALPASEDILVKNNAFSAMFGWDREALTTDGPGGFYFGPVSMGAPNSVRMLDDRRNQRTDKWAGAAFYVVGGQGFGQYARVTALSGDVVELDRALETPLDSSSLVTIVPAQENYVIVNNSFEDTGTLQIFGTSMNHVFAGNTFKRSTGIRISGGNYGYPQPSWFTEVLDNSIETASGFAPTRLEVSAWRGANARAGEQVVTYGTIVRDNRLGPMVKVEISGPWVDPPMVGGTILEHNELADGLAGIQARVPGGNVLARTNTVGPASGARPEQR